MTFLVFVLAVLSPTVQTRLDQKIEAMLRAFGAPSVSVAVVDDGKAAYIRAFGTNATPETRYAVGSISKQFTAAALLLAQEQGKVSIDDKVGKYFPNLTRANEVTIRELLSHTSGYEDFAPQDYIIPEWTKPTTPEATMERWATKPLNFDPGTRWQYSNTNYIIAGKILEKAIGQNLLSFLDEHIFSPLGMKSAGGWTKPGFPDAKAYTRFALGPPRPVDREGDGWYFAAGELAMTAADLAKWDIAVLEHKILSKKSYEEFTKEVTLKDGQPTHYALGLSLRQVMSTPTLSHGGEVSGFLASNTVFPTKNAAVIVFSNEDGVSMTEPMAHDISAVVLGFDNRDELMKAVLEDLQRGELKKELFTEDALAYFNDQARSDYRSSLRPLGELVVLSLQNEQQRGGMTHLSYRAHFKRETVGLNIYLMPNGKIEQFLVEEQL